MTNQSEAQSETAAPTASAERIAELDVIRGLALFVVLWINFVDHQRFAIPRDVLEALPTAGIDRVVGLLTAWLVSRKAQALFSLLFGFGFAILTERATARGASAGRIYVRRIAILFAIGLAHYLLLWFGDILHAYAAMGFLLLFTRRWPNWLLLAIGIPLAIGSTAALGVYSNFVLQPGERAPWMVEAAAGLARRWEVFRGDDYLAFVRELFRFATREVYGQPTGLAFLGWILGRFLIGAWVCRQGWLQNTGRYARQFRRWTIFLILPGLLMAGVRPALGFFAVRPGPAWQPWISLIDLTSQLVLALGYAAGIVVLCQNERWRRRLAGFSAAGQMALTNYVMQSFVFFFVLYGFGLGWLPYDGSTFCLAAAIVVFAVQIRLSRWWLAKYRFGPAEWLWRSATYGKWQTLRRV